MTEDIARWFRGAPGFIKALPYVIAIFSGSAAGGITATYSAPSGRSFEAAEARILGRMDHQLVEFGRIFHMLSDMDTRQRAIATKITRLEVITESLKSEHTNAHP